MKKFIFVLSLLGLAGCDYKAEKKIDKNNGDDYPVHVIQIQSKSLECVKIGAVGMSCNWDKYNKQ